jgi:predicted nucleotidyltransferase
MNGRPRRHCYRCGHVWVPRQSRVRLCARCKSPYYWYPKVRVPTYGGGLGITEVIGPNRRKVLEISRGYGATNVRVFGSVARRAATSESDVDFVVDRLAGTKFRRLDLSLALARLLRRRVDVVTEDGIYWLVQPRIVEEAIPL